MRRRSEQVLKTFLVIMPFFMDVISVHSVCGGLLHGVNKVVNFLKFVSHRK